MVEPGNEPPEQQTPTESNPYAVTTQLPGAPPRAAPGKRRAPLGPRAFWTATTLLALLLVGAPLSAGFAQWDVESIVASGSVMTILALILLAVTRFRGPHSYSLIAVAVIAFCLFIFAWIYLNRWRPADAQRPVSRAIGWYAAVHSLGWFVLLGQVIKRRRQPVEPMEDAVPPSPTT